MKKFTTISNYPINEKRRLEDDNIEENKMQKTIPCADIPELQNQPPQFSSITFPFPSEHIKQEPDIDMNENGDNSTLLSDDSDHLLMGNIKQEPAIDIKDEFDIEMPQEAVSKPLLPYSVLEKIKDEPNSDIDDDYEDLIPYTSAKNVKLEPDIDVNDQQPTNSKKPHHVYPSTDILKKKPYIQDYKCKKCSCEFLSDRSRKKHEQRHLRTDLLCGKCFSSFENTLDLELHLYQKHKITLIKTESFFIFLPQHLYTGALQRFKYHEKNHIANKYECTDCNYFFSMPALVAAHANFACPTLGKDSMSPRNLVESQIKSTNIKEWFCRTCAKHFENSLSWELHMYQLHSMTYNKDRSFFRFLPLHAWLNALKRFKHHENNELASQYECIECNAKFGNNHEVAEHSLEHCRAMKKEKNPALSSAARPYLKTNKRYNERYCHPCLKTFSNCLDWEFHLFQTHSMTHTKAKSFFGFLPQTDWLRVLKSFRYHENNDVAQKYECLACETFFQIAAEVALHASSSCYLKIKEEFPVLKSMAPHSSVVKKQNTKARFCHECLKDFEESLDWELHLFQSHNMTYPKEKSFFGFLPTKIWMQKLENFKFHEDNFDGSNKYECIKCCKFFGTKALVSSHASEECEKKGENPGKSHFKCLFHCGKSFGNRLDFEMHLFQKHQTTIPHEQSFFRSLPVSVWQQNPLKRFKHRLGRYQCHKCVAIFNDSTQVLQHSRFFCTCSLCPQLFKTHKDRIEHRLSHCAGSKMPIENKIVKPNVYKCGVCNESFASSQCLNRHMNTIHEHILACCSKTFDSKLVYELHQYQQHKRVTWQNASVFGLLSINLRRKAWSKFKYHEDADHNYECIECKQFFEVQEQVVKHAEIDNCNSNVDIKVKMEKFTTDENGPNSSEAIADIDPLSIEIKIEKSDTTEDAILPIHTCIVCDQEFHCIELLKQHACMELT